MNDRAISAGCCVATTLWVVAVALLAAATIDRLAILGIWGLATSAAAATATVRCFFVRQARTFDAAYRLGRDAEHSSVARLR